MNNYSEKVYNGYIIYHWHHICPNCKDISGSFSFNKELNTGTVCYKCDINKIAIPFNLIDECDCKLKIDKWLESLQKNK